MIWYDFISITLQPKGRIATYKQTQKIIQYISNKNKQRQTEEKSNNHTKDGAIQEPPRELDANTPPPAANPRSEQNTNTGSFELWAL